MRAKGGRVSVVRIILNAGAAFFVLAGCSSAPKRPAEVFVARNMAETQLELANKEADRGNYEQALDLLAEARRIAVSADNPSLLIRTELSRGNIFFYLGRTGEARSLWEGALAEAETAGEAELASAGRIYMARSRLLTGGAETAGEVAGEVRGEIGRIKANPLYAALGWTVIGLAEKERGRWDEAEKALRNALAFHEKENYLELAAYDWYLIASVRSVAGQYPAAGEALAQALNFDRRAENTYGLGMDWLAIGDVRRKAGNGPGAEAAYRRSADIFRSLGLEKEAAAAEGRI
jgi:tetratricopeptide (TPR) repeat protein